MREGKFFEGKPVQLFHYTDVNAVKSILENKKLWLTDVRYLNDSQEMHDGVSNILRYVKYQSDTFSKRHELFFNSAEFVIARLGGLSDYGLDRRPVFICSFSRASDLLSQWRAYGSYAIEFSRDAMPAGLSKCVYDADEKLERASDVALKSLMTIANDMECNDGFLDFPGLKAYSDLVGLAATFKHESFSEEQEVRLIAGHDIDPDLDDGLPVKYRSRGDILVPFVEVDISLRNIKAIHIGPMRDQELACISMKAFLNNIRHAQEVALENYSHEIKVIKSDIPYRAP
ncbi:DUF2971 domain-containing protein [Pseudomonas sp. GL-B-26]|uniref:DUF2971 domain-containing protein n=1 Tax=Pseudomonas sp. GL-B-26 TaxID=2832394 RepID=UPI001CC0960C|nr:DUF2971 domain-containing protein [Pseudomonas sp. GL-B-26]